MDIHNKCGYFLLLACFMSIRLLLDQPKECRGVEIKLFFFLHNTSFLSTPTNPNSFEFFSRVFIFTTSQWNFFVQNWLIFIVFPFIACFLPLSFCSQNVPTWNPSLSSLLPKYYPFFKVCWSSPFLWYLPWLFSSAFSEVSSQ